MLIKYTYPLIPLVLYNFFVIGAIEALILLTNPSSPRSLVKKKKGNRAGKMFVAHTLSPVKLALIATSGTTIKQIIINNKKTDKKIVLFFK